MIILSNLFIYKKNIPNFKVFIQKIMIDLNYEFCKTDTFTFIRNSNLNWNWLILTNSILLQIGLQLVKNYIYK